MDSIIQFFKTIFKEIKKNYSEYLIATIIVFTIVYIGIVGYVTYRIAKGSIITFYERKIYLQEKEITELRLRLEGHFKRLDASFNK